MDKSYFYFAIMIDKVCWANIHQIKFFGKFVNYTNEFPIQPPINEYWSTTKSTKFFKVETITIMVV
jgi:hypothetical protein